jgi:DNA-directed RNA polymerase subunit M/transcription elongation factor TFIIS
MSFCDACGDLYKVEAATGAAAAKGVEGLVAVCSSCGKVETVTKGQ